MELLFLIVLRFIPTVALLVVFAYVTLKPNYVPVNKDVELNKVETIHSSMVAAQEQRFTIHYFPFPLFTSPLPAPA